MRFRRLGALAAVLGVAAAGVAVGLVGTGSAQDAPPSASSATQTVTVTQTVATTAESGTSHSHDAVWILIFGGLSLVLVFAYLMRWQENIVKLSRAALARTGTLPQYELNPNETQTRGGVPGEEAGPTIIGPAVVTVGQPTRFLATVGGSPAQCTWTVTPADAATVSPAAGSETDVTAQKDGQFTLAATADGGATSSTTIAAVPAPAATSRVGALPVIGVGYGGVTVAILAVTVAAALTAIGRLPGAALATLLGTVVAYFFVQHRAEGPSSNGQAAPGGSPQSGGGSGEDGG